MKRAGCTNLVLLLSIFMLFAFSSRAGFGQPTQGGSLLTTIQLAGPNVEYAPYDFDKKAHAKNVGLVSYLDSEPSLKMDIQEVDGKWYLYLAHYWPPHGWTVVDISDPGTPKIVKRMSEPNYPNDTDTTQIAVADGLMLVSLEPYPFRERNAPFNEGVMIFDVKTDPADPRLLSHWKTGGAGTHRITYFGGRYAHVSAHMPGYKGDIYVILDVSDPKNPKEAGRWWIPGQKKGESDPLPAYTLLHTAMADGNIAYLSYFGPGFYMLDISDPAHPKMISHLSFSPPFQGSLGTHSAYPLPGTYNPFPYKGRRLVLTNGEAIAEACQEAPTQASLVDITDIKNPTLVAELPVPAPPKGAPYGNFCEKMGRFGPHNSNDLFLNPFVQHSHNLVYLTWFNAGLRVFDISDPRLPKEVGYFIPPNPTKRSSIIPKMSLVTQSQYGLVDKRGYIYLSDWNQGIYILKYTGPYSNSP